MNKTMAKLLVAEDDKFISEIYATKLQAEGFEVAVAEDGEAAIKKIKEEKPDMVLLDIFMPKFDGIEVLRQIKQLDEVKDIPVIVLTNASEKEYVDQAMQLGAVDYLIKSNFTPDEVKGKLEKYLNKK